MRQEQVTKENKGNYCYLCYQMREDEVLDTLEYGMLSNNKLEGILSTSLYQMDEERSLRFDITSKIPLNEYFAGVIRKERRLKIINSILQAISEADEYMIGGENLILQQEYIYVNVANETASLICLPIVNIEEQKESWKEFFRVLIFETGVVDTSENTEYILQLMNYLNGSGFSVEGLKKVVISLLQGKDRVSESAQTHKAKPVLQQAPEVNVASQPSAEEKKAQFGGAVLGTPEIPLAAAKEPEKKFGFGGLFGSKKVEKPEKTMPETIKGARMNVPGQPPQPPKSVPGMSIPGQAVSIPQVSIPTPVAAKPVEEKKESKGWKLPSFGEKEQKTVAPVMHEPKQNVAVPEGGTVIIQDEQDNGATIIAGMKSAAMQIRPYIVRKSTGEKAYITKDVFHIGRQQGYADFVVQNNGTVGRAHADIIKQGEVFFLKDNNSANHTYIEGRQVYSGTPESLEHGANFQLSNEEFNFYLY